MCAETAGEDPEFEDQAMDFEDLLDGLETTGEAAGHSDTEPAAESNDDDPSAQTATGGDAPAVVSAGGSSM